MPVKSPLIRVMALALLLTCGLAGQTPLAAQQDKAAPGGDAAAMDANAAFGALAKDFIAKLAELNPVGATSLGVHDYDDRLPDVSANGRAASLAADKAALAALGRIDRARLTPDNQVDAALLENTLQYSIWDAETLREWAWNPQVYNDVASLSLYSLVARDFAPWPERFAAITARMEKLPAFLAESRKALDPALVPKVHAETVARQNAGLTEIIEAAIVPEVEKSGLDHTRFDAALAGLRIAVAEQQKWLDEVLVPNAKGDFRLGPELYDRKMAFALMSDITRPQLKASARTAFDATRAEMERIARTLPGCDKSDQQHAIECGLALSYANRPPRAEVEAKAGETLAEATAFTAAQGFVTMPDGPVKVITMPKFQQGNSVAYDDPPGALEKDQPNFFAVSPIPDDWSEEQATSFLTEYNTYMLHDLSIHEGVPGHYLQLDHANKDTDPLRAVLQSGPFIEGWAVYSEGLMADENYLGGDPLFKLTVLKMRLRSIINTLLDIGIQTERMSEQQALDLMMQGGFQQEREASGKWLRARLSSTQLLSYYTGYLEHTQLRAEAEKRWGADFTLRRYHDEVLAHGSPPVKYVRALMFGLPID